MCKEMPCKRAGIHAKVGDIVETTLEYEILGIGKYEKCVVHALDGKTATLKSGHVLSVGWLQIADSLSCSWFKRFTGGRSKCDRIHRTCCCPCS